MSQTRGGETTGPVTTLPARYYLDPGHYRAEMGRFFLERWVCVGRSEEVGKPRDYLRLEVGGESVVVLRDDGGELQAFFNVCRHRGTRLCEGGGGRLAATIACPYHAWTYDLKGRLVGAPHMEEVPGFRLEDWPLVSLGVCDWEGHLFLHLGSVERPLGEQLASLSARFQAWGMAGLRRARRIEYEVRANWKLLIHNYSECLHCPVNHPMLERLSHYKSGVNEPATDDWLGGAMDLREGVETLTVDGVRRREWLPGLGPEQRRRVHYYAILPNLLLSLHPDYMMTHTLWPLECDLTRVVCEWHFDPVEMERPGFDPDDAVRFWDQTNREDWALSELTQAGLSSRGFRPGPYSAREGLLAEFDRIILGACEADG